ncbi:Transthyretin-like family protein [Oesophagostomum dentatum]|uniref:Transthyretin-like family protein n=1 Tax=Oesophagostomum dentatum TaxID=61180 RepID=A0A0B1T5C6_OESDE|nr:Transthyretin-like family protein [Oesophagostomum dentatum]
MESNLRVLCSLLLALFVCCSSIRQQSVAVSGRLMCGNQPAAGVRVKLWDEDDALMIYETVCESRNHWTDLLHKKHFSSFLLVSYPNKSPTRRRT